METAIRARLVYHGTVYRFWLHRGETLVVEFEHPIGDSRLFSSQRIALLAGEGDPFWQEMAIKVNAIATSRPLDFSGPITVDTN